MKLYKLTDENHQTRGGCQWGAGVEHTADGQGPLCSKHWLHAYAHTLLAVLLNPIHGNFQKPVLWEAEGDVGATDRGLKVGCTRLKTIRILPLPEITTEQRVRFGILCAKQVYDDAKWNAWADAWLSGADRSDAAAWTAADAAAGAAWAADAAAWAAARAAWAADAAAWAAGAANAAAAEKPLGLIALAEQAIKEADHE